ncbi:uncharacterized protein LOC128309194 [Anopheles moucheti]|uniref:uncharacterized protein LOC128309194 n=1 Tax=Anopheles moucheti TaxID=186751 RepID=UPI0022F0CB80|nr:uncharacterized protein LOC128309194 [Anopheles moucheti]
MANHTTLLRKKKTSLNTLAGLEAFKETFDETDRYEIPVRLELIDQCKEDFVTIMNKLEEEKEELVDDENHIQERAASFGGPMQLRLPKIELPSFNGEATKWLTFKDRFISMIHSAAEIPAVMKLQYLLASLVGEAATHFEHTEVIADNYAVTWNALLKRYDDKKALVREYYRALHFLPRMETHHVDDLARLVDDFTRHVKGLRKLGEPIDHWDTPLTNLLFLKMDKLSIVAWEELGSERDGYGELVKFLEERVRMLKSSKLLEQPATDNVVKVAGTKVAGTMSSDGIGNHSSDSSKNNTSKPFKCPLLCTEAHNLNTCQMFAQKTVKQRQEVVKQHRLCWNCLRAGHAVRNCVSRFTCQTCKAKHHTLLHDPAASRLSMVVQAEETQPNGLVLLETAIIFVMDDYGHVFKARALLDSGSMNNFMTQAFAKQLLGSRAPIDINVMGISNTITNVKSAVTSRIQTKDERVVASMQFLILNHNLTPQVPVAEIDISTWNLPTVELADTRFNVPEKIDIIIGGEAYWEFHSGKKITLGKNRPWLTETAFGWTVAGSVPSSQSCVPRVCGLSSATDPLDCILKRFWELETINDGINPTVEDAMEHHYTNTTTRDSSGRYVVALPWTNDQSSVLGESKPIADRRLYGMERRWERNPTLKTAYLSFMEEYLQLGHMRKLEEPIDDNVSHCYIPHHAVFKESTALWIMEMKRSLNVSHFVASPLNEGSSIFGRRNCMGPPKLALPEDELKVEFAVGTISFTD